jgi:hypothetical protein
MGESRARTGFGQVDLQLGDERDVEEETSAAFGELDWDFPEPDPSSATNRSSRQTVRREDAAMEAVIDSTRVVSHAVMSPILDDERDKTPPPASLHSGQHGAPCSSRVEPTNDRVAAMREAYARGDADGALAIANAIEAATVPPPAGGFDHPDAAVDVEFGEESEIEIDEEDPVDAKDLTRIAPSASVPPASLRPGIGSLTERQGIPRVLLGPQEIARLPIDHRAGFLLGFSDGMQTMEEILDVCAMPQTEALELIRTLVDMGVITIE